MVESKHAPDFEGITDEEFEAWCAKQPKRSQQEVEEDVENFLMHPLNCKELTPEMLERPEYQALQALAYEGSKSEVAQNFLHHALDQLGKILLSTTKNKEKDY